MKTIYLASKSPRRKEILKNAGLVFKIINSDYNEKIDNLKFSYEQIEYIAKNKAFGALKNIPNEGYILGADTVVVLDEKILIKPKDRSDAINILKLLNNKKHFVVTSHCLLDSKTEKYIINSTTTLVEFNNLSQEQIISYIDKYKPYDKAGAYGIQELPDNYVKNINGDIENVIGLSSQAVIETMSQLETLLKE